MKKTLIILSLLLIIILTSCETEFTFEGLKFGDTLDTIKKEQGEPDRTDTTDGIDVLIYIDKDLLGYKGSNLYIGMINERLQSIVVFSSVYQKNKTLDSIYKDILNKLNIGKPDLEELNEEKDYYKAFWDKGDYGITAVVSSNNSAIAFNKDSQKSRENYDVFNYTEFFKE